MVMTPRYRVGDHFITFDYNKEGDVIEVTDDPDGGGSYGVRWWDDMINHYFIRDVDEKKSWNVLYNVFDRSAIQDLIGYDS